MEVTPERIREVEKKAKRIRRETLELAMKHKEGHLGPSFSIVEILVSLYEEILKEEDKFILSKGHGSLSLYAVLRSKGFNPKVATHPDIDREQGIECTTGSLGHGLPMSVGMALAKKMKGKRGRVFVLMGDGECQEGTTWESMLVASHHKLDNLTVIVDHNKIQALDRIENVLSFNSLAEKFRCFGAHVIEVDGHSIEELINAFNTEVKGRPKVIIAHTVKGKGLSFAENNPVWHSRLPTQKQYLQALKELE